ncbi:MAG: HAMP domain-containing sensor histidine kinase [Bdellovibrionota bacterium]
MSPTSWILIVIATYVPVIAVLQPSWLEILILLIVDNGIAGYLNYLTEAKVFTKLCPDTKVYFYDTPIAEIQKQPFDQKIEMVHSVLKFPLRRALFCYFWGLVKTIPAFLVIVFVWKHSRSNFEQFLMCFLMVAVNCAFFLGSVYIHAHAFLSGWLAKIHETYDWSDVFREVKIEYARRDYILHEMGSLLYLLVFILVLQWHVLAHGGKILNLSPTTAASGLVVIGLILFTHNFFLSRRYLVSALENIFLTMDRLNYVQGQKNSLPLHSMSLMARFEKTFNALSDRLTKAELEISQHVFKEVDRSRFYTMGEISALIAHDLSGPLHAAHFCASELKTGQEPEKTRKLIEHLTTNIDRAIELVTSLRARLKNPDIAQESTRLTDAHRHVVRLLDIQYHQGHLSQIVFEIDNILDTITVKIPRADLMHILDNLYRNSIDNLLKNQVSQPKIKISLLEQSTANTTISIEDNGTGLTREAFESLTDQAENTVTAKSLGLRLTRKLIEQRKGLLQADRLDEGGVSGTRFLLTLPNADSGVKEG